MPNIAKVVMWSSASFFNIFNWEGDMNPRATVMKRLATVSKSADRLTFAEYS